MTESKRILREMISAENRICQNVNEKFFVILSLKIRPSRMKLTKIAQKMKKYSKKLQQKNQTRLNQETIKKVV
jgi:hypothetical protein